MAYVFVLVATLITSLLPSLDKRGPDDMSFHFSSEDMYPTVNMANSEETCMNIY